VTDYSPQAIWGRLLRHYRKRAGLTQIQLAEIINYSDSTISAYETGQEAATPEFAEACDGALQTGGALVVTLDYRKGEDIPSWFDWPRYERDSRILRAYEISVVYGLLQTPDYARVVLHGNERQLSNRLVRQGVLTSEVPPPPVVTCVLNEMVLHNLIGSREIMAEQLRHLASSVSDRVHIHVLRSGVKRPWLAGAFVLATLDDNREITYVETALRGTTLGDAVDVRKLAEKFEAIRAQALPVDMSLDLINKVVEERWT
jgi:transcriptional regulator with XRE-family HTH domain